MLVRKDIYLVWISPVRIPALWNYFVVPKVLWSPPGFPEVTSLVVVRERSGLRSEKSLLMGRPLCSHLGFPRSRVRESSFDGSSCCLLPHVTWIQRDLTLSLLYSGKHYKVACAVSTKLMQRLLRIHSKRI